MVLGDDAVFFDQNSCAYPSVQPVPIIHKFELLYMFADRSWSFRWTRAISDALCTNVPIAADILLTILPIRPQHLYNVRVVATFPKPLRYNAIAA
jgi:hypothetical protein